MRLIGLCGKKQSGKTTLANHIATTQGATLYAYADKLKELCIDLFGLTTNQCYGSEADKNTHTKVLWENMPFWKFDEYPIGPMTAREVLQHVGTDVVRRINENAWTDYLIEKIRKDGKFAVIHDVRFTNEALAISRAGGHLIRLTRGGSGDNHASETGLDNFHGFDFILDNANMTLEESKQALSNYLST